MACGHFFMRNPHFWHGLRGFNTDLTRFLRFVIGFSRFDNIVLFLAYIKLSYYLCLQNQVHSQKYLVMGRYLREAETLRFEGRRPSLFRRLRNY